MKDLRCRCCGRLLGRVEWPKLQDAIVEQSGTVEIKCPRCGALNRTQLKNETERRKSAE